MFRLSLGAESFARFWQFWNPIWGYYLGRFIFTPLKKNLPATVALVLTFAVSGALHDLAVMAVKWRCVFFFTPWFFLMGLTVVLTKKLNINYKTVSWPSRAMINGGFVVGNLAMAMWIEHFYV
ncbi:MAG: acyltransferase [Gammaproteobacteria bacterium]|nr:acyltransferase [Gammaproteobacteria bacterium]